MDTDKTLADLRTRITQATAASARAQVEYENAQRERQEALEALLAFGVTNTEEAKAKIAQYEAAFAKAVAEVEAALEEA